MTTSNDEYRYESEFWRRLPHWLKHTTWLKRDATLLICGVLPEPFESPGTGPDYYFHISSGRSTFVLKTHEKRYLQDSIDDVERLWESDPNHSDQAHVEEWIRWALENDIEIDWFDWAKNNNLIKNIQNIKKETPDERKTRLIKRKEELKGKGIKNFIETIAKEEKISATRVKQIISKS